LKNTLHFGDSIEIMKTFPDKSVSHIICDPPFGTTKCSWDVIIPFADLWQQYNRIIKNRGNIILFGSGLFFYDLCISNREKYRGEIIWEKERPTNIFFMKHSIGKVHENIALFGDSYGIDEIHENIALFGEPNGIYNPQMEDRINKSIGVFGKPKKSNTHKDQIYKYADDYDSTKTYPRSVVKINRDTLSGSLHPTQKPVELLEFLIRNYSNPGDIILDNTMGSGTTCIAAINTERYYIGIEKDPDIFNTAQTRIENHRIIQKTKLF
jgi:site-specific DNA-methyltransferase (adenine-specific)